MTKIKLLIVLSMLGWLLMPWIASVGIIVLIGALIPDIYLRLSQSGLGIAIIFAFILAKGLTSFMEAFGASLVESNDQTKQTPQHRRPSKTFIRALSQILK